MSCERCRDIHSAQLTGKTTDKCNCDCHSKTNWVQLQQDCERKCTCGQMTTATCPVHGNVLHFNTTFCTSDGCSVINLNNLD